MRTLLSVIAAFSLLIGSSAWAQSVTSGPDKGKTPPELKVFDTTGPHKDKEVEFVADRKDKPTIYIFVAGDKFDRPMARYIRTLDEAIGKEVDDSYVVAVWLTDDVEKTKQHLPRVQQSIKLQKTALTCFTGEKAGPKDWNVNSDAHLTTVIVAKGKVTETFGYRSLNETDVPAVLDAFKKARESK